MSCCQCASVETAINQYIIPDLSKIAISYCGSRTHIHSEKFEKIKQTQEKTKLVYALMVISLGLYALWLYWQEHKQSKKLEIALTEGNIENATQAIQKGARASLSVDKKLQMFDSRFLENLNKLIDLCGKDEARALLFLFYQNDPSEVSVLVKHAIMADRKLVNKSKILSVYLSYLINTLPEETAYLPFLRGILSRHPVDLETIQIFNEVGFSDFDWYIAFYPNQFANTPQFCAPAIEKLRHDAQLP
ncbi:MAG: hypothetical protein V4487_02245 [Chlamydiota bacterium]